MRDEATPEVRDDEAASRYELVVDGHPAGRAEYRFDPATNVITFVHTVIDPAFEGRGLGGRLAAGALDDVRRRQLRVVAECPFMAGYIDRHPAYADLLAAKA